MDYLEILIRLGVATILGGAIGLNRDLQGKPTGIRTLSTVSLGCAAIVIASMNFEAPGPIDWAAVSRVIQGILTGIGFLGVGVIVRPSDPAQVQGLTTAALIWFTAAIGVLCGIGAWSLLAIAVPLVFLVLIFGGPIEQAAHRWWDQRRK